MDYRGRVLVEVISDMDNALKSTSVNPIRQKKPEFKDTEYILFGIFISANMIHPHDKPIQFEVSIGKGLLFMIE